MAGEEQTAGPARGDLLRCSLREGPVPGCLPFIYLYNQTIEPRGFFFLQRQTKKKKTVDIEKRPRV